MNLPRAMTLLLVVSLLFQPVLPVTALNPIKLNRSTETARPIGTPPSADENPAPRVDIQASSHSSAGEPNDRPYLSVIYKTGIAKLVSTSTTRTGALPMVSATQPITNGEDIVYLVNSKQIGRTQNFSASSPTWISPSRIVAFHFDSSSFVNLFSSFHYSWN